MDSDQNIGTWRCTLFVATDASAILFDGGRTIKDGSSSRRAQGDDYIGLDELQFSLQPLMTGGNLHLIRFLVDATFAARFELEVLDGVRYVSRLAIDPSISQSPIQ